MDTNIVGQSSSNLTQSTDKFNNLYGTNNAWGTATATLSVMPVSGTLKNFYLNCDAGPGAGLSRTFAVYKNGADTALTITLTGAGTGAGISTGNDVTHTVAFAAGDTISIHSTATGTTTSAATVRWTLAATCSPGQSMLLACSGGGMGTTFPCYVAPQSNNTDTTAVNVEAVMPTNGNIKNAYIVLNNNPTVGMTFTLVKNGVDTALVVIVAGTGISGSDTNAGHAVSVVAGDRLYWRCSASSGATRTSFISAEFEPAVNGESVHMYGSSRAPTTTAGRYQTIASGASGTYAAVESSQQVITQAARWRNLYVYEQTAPGGSSNWTYATSINGVFGFSATPQVTISGANTTGSDTTTVTTSVAGQTVAMLVTPSGSPNIPAAGLVEWGIVSYIPPPNRLALLGVG